MSDQNSDKEEATKASPKVVVQCIDGGCVETTEETLKQIPYFDALLSGRWKRGDVIRSELERPVLYSCISFAEAGSKCPFMLLTKLSTKASPEQLVQAMEFLCMEIKTIGTLEELKELETKLKDTKLLEEMQENARRRSFGRSYQIPNRVGARDAAATLCFSLLKRSLPVGVGDKVWSDVRYVLSHPRIFGPRIRTHLWNTFLMECLIF